jgi:apolipoprotein N-acyltransferase
VPSSDESISHRGAVYSEFWRIALAVLATVTAASCVTIFARLVFFGEGPHNPVALVRSVAALAALPWAAFLSVRRAFAARMHVEGETLVIEQDHRRTEIPVGEIAALEPWRLPFPGCGFRVRLKSGRLWGEAIEVYEPVPWVDALVDAGGSRGFGALRERSSVIYAQAVAGRERTIPRMFAKYVLFALIPTIPLFRVHQIIAYGGVFGEYHQYGLGPYLAGFAIYWATLVAYLILYGVALRVFVEALSLAAALIAPSSAAAVRRLAELTSRLLFYGGVPTLLALRFAA